MITDAAILFEGKIYTGRRHGFIIQDMVLIHGCKPPIYDGQGFVDEDGKFYTRKEATEYVLAVGQIKELKWPPQVYSEDLWDLLPHERRFKK